MITDSVQQVKETVKSVTESQGSHSSFTNLSEVAKAAEKEVADVAQDGIEAASQVTDAVEEAVSETPVQVSEAEEQIEEFFDDGDSSL